MSSQKLRQASNGRASRDSSVNQLKVAQAQNAHKRNTRFDTDENQKSKKQVFESQKVSQQNSLNASLCQINKCFGNEQSLNTIHRDRLLQKHQQSQKPQLEVQYSPSKQITTSAQHLIRPAASPSHPSSMVHSTSNKSTTPKISAIGRGEQRYCNLLESDPQNESQEEYKEEDVPDHMPSNYFTNDSMIGAHLLKNRELAVVNLSVFTTPKRPETHVSPYESKISNVVQVAPQQSQTILIYKGTKSAEGHKRNVSFGGSIVDEQTSSFIKVAQVQPKECLLTVGNSLKPKQVSSPIKSEILNPRVATSPPDKSVLSLNLQQQQKQTLLQVLECGERSAEKSPDSPAKLQPFIESTGASPNLRKVQTKSLSPMKLKLEPVQVIAEKKHFVQKRVDVTKSPGKDNSPTRQALLRSIERHKKRHGGQGDIQVDERIVEAMIEGLARINHNAEVINEAPSSLELESNRGNKPSQERRKRDQRLKSSTNDNYQSKKTGIVKPKIQETSKLTTEGNRSLSRNQTLHSSIATSNRQRRDASTNSILRGSTTKSNNEKSFSKTKISSKVTSELLMLTSCKAEDQMNNTSLQVSPTLNLNLTKALASKTVQQPTAAFNPVQNQSVISPSNNSKSQPETNAYQLVSSSTLGLNNIFDARVYSTNSSVQTEVVQMQTDQSSPVKRATSYLSQTASSRLKSREPSASHLNPLKAARQNSSQYVSMQISPQKTPLAIFKRESPSRAAREALEAAKEAREAKEARDNKLIQIRHRLAAHTIASRFQQIKQIRHDRELARQRAEAERQRLIEAQRIEALRIASQREIAAVKIQRSFKCFLFRQRLVIRSARFSHMKKSLKDVICAWRTRRALNCLCNEVQDFVNCENLAMKARYRFKFHCLFGSVLQNTLYLEKKALQLQTLIADTDRKLMQKPVAQKASQVSSQMKIQEEHKSPQKKDAQPPHGIPRATEQHAKEAQKPVATKSSASRGQLKNKRSPMPVANSRQMQQRHPSTRNSLERMHQSFESIRSSENQRVITELKHFIRNSSEKNFHCESVCSIQVINQGEQNRAGHKTSALSIMNNKISNRINHVANHPVISDIYSSQEDSPVQERNLKSKYVSQKNKQRVSTKDLGQTPSMASSEMFRQLTTQEIAAKTTHSCPVNKCINEKPANRAGDNVVNEKTQMNLTQEMRPKSRGETSGSAGRHQMKDLQKHASGYKSKIKQVTSRVDCWNRSVSKDVTSNDVAQKDIVVQTQQPQIAELAQKIIDDHRKSCQTPNRTATFQAEFSQTHGQSQEIKQAARVTKEMLKNENVLSKNNTGNEIRKFVNVEHPQMNLVIANGQQYKSQPQSEIKQMPKAQSKPLEQQRPQSNLRKPTPNPIKKQKASQALETIETPAKVINMDKDFSSQINSIQKQRTDTTGSTTKLKSSSCGPTAKSKVTAASRRVEKTEKTEMKDEKEQIEFLQTYNSSQFAGSFVKQEPQPAKAPVKPAAIDSVLSAINEKAVKSMTPASASKRIKGQSCMNLKQFINNSVKRIESAATPHHSTQPTAVTETISNLKNLMDNLSTMKISQEAVISQPRSQKRRQSQTITSATNQSLIGMQAEQRAQERAVTAAEKDFKQLVASLENHFEQIKQQLLQKQ